MNRHNLNDQAIKGYHGLRYSMAWKTATIELSTNISEGNQGKRGFGANAVAKKYNENLLSSTNDKKIKNNPDQISSQRRAGNISQNERVKTL